MNLKFCYRKSHQNLMTFIVKTSESIHEYLMNTGSVMSNSVNNLTKPSPKGVYRGRSEGSLAEEWRAKMNK